MARYLSNVTELAIFKKKKKILSQIREASYSYLYLYLLPVKIQDDILFLVMNVIMYWSHDLCMELKTYENLQKHNADVICHFICWNTQIKNTLYLCVLVPVSSYLWLLKCIFESATVKFKLMLLCLSVNCDFVYFFCYIALFTFSI